MPISPLILLLTFGPPSEPTAVVQPEGPAPAAQPEADEPSASDAGRLEEALAPKPGGLTANAVAAAAVDSSPNIAQRRAELTIAAAQVDGTMVAFVPQVNLSATYRRVTPIELDFATGGATVGAFNEGPLLVDMCPPEIPAPFCVIDSGGELVGAVAGEPFELPVNQYSLQASLSIPVSDYIFGLLPARRGSKAQLEAAELQRDAEVEQVYVDAKLAYYDWVRAEAQVVVAEHSLERTKARLEDARIGQSAGILTETDVVRLDGLVASAENAVTSSENFRDLAAENLAIMMGTDKADFEIGEDVFTEPKDIEVGSVDDMVEEAYANRIELRVLGRNRDVLEYGVKAARVAYFPRLDAFGDITYANPNQLFFPASNEWNANWAVGISVSWSLTQMMQARAQVKELKGNLQLLDAQDQSIERGLRLEVLAAVQERKRALKSIRSTERAETSAEAAYEQTAQLYQGGEATTTDVLEAEGERINATLQHVNALIDLRVANAKIARATGRDQLEAIE